ncbi:MAG: DNA mismatch repair protein MutS, partial [Oscillospiraceae bacterium]|nr:DNA mismatch repair protein MutS [Oscillospiraceae bacterium]
EQTEDPKSVKGLVKREVIRVVTPGTVIDENMLDEKDNNYLACIYAGGNAVAAAFADITTGEIFATAFEKDKTILFNETARYAPAEIIVNQYTADSFGNAIRDRFNISVKICGEDIFENGKGDGERFKKNIPDIDGRPELISCINGLISYFEHTQKLSPDYFSDISVYSIKQYMDIDMSTRRNLEITESLRDRVKKGSLLWVLDKTKTSMGARLLKQWLEKPLVNPVAVNSRLYAVDELVKSPIIRDDLSAGLAGIYDISRISVRISLNTATPPDLISLKKSLEKLPEIKNILLSCGSAMLKGLADELDDLADIKELIEKSIKEDAPSILRDGGIIKEGFNKEVDELRFAMTDGKKWIARIENEEKEKTGIKNLRINFNKVFGYYIEVTKSNLKDVPDRYMRKQTLANCERYITEELKNVENTIMGASERIVVIESDLYDMIRKSIAEEVERLRKVCDAVAKIDVLCSLAVVAAKNGYVMPEMCESGEITIQQGRHPVVEEMLKDELFVPNDTLVNNKNARLIIITGPNMSGKSTFMRQTALITLMAQIGSFVPAQSARISAVDKIFTRVGASDDIASGQSTFMVEMSEVANILKNATGKSLIIMDEIGRGTSTFDGLSIAWAVAEYIEKKIKAKTLFATHYHEMTTLAERYDGIVNYHIAVKKYQGEITFLRKVTEGSADGSYGIEVAALAGVPKEVTVRAKNILKDLEKSDLNKPDAGKINSGKEESNQLGFADNAADDIIKELKSTDVMSLTPIEAINVLSELSRRAKEF